MTRDEMINRLIDDDVETILGSNQSIDYLVSILRRGTGYELQLDQEIVQEYHSRTWEDE
jgi:ABC-type proline/glycine betaine transport system ATPase subunit